MQYRIELISEDRETVEWFGRACWEEVDRGISPLPYELDWDAYLSAESTGNLRYYTVLTDTGVKVGMAVFLISRSLHSKGRYIATSDCLYILPKYRGHGPELLNLIAGDLKQERVSAMFINVKAWMDKKGAFGRVINSRLIEHVYQRGL